MAPSRYDEQPFSEAELRYRLGPTLRKIQDTAVTFTDAEIPRKWHSCSKQSRLGKTKFSVQVSDNPFRTEFCGCGSSRQWLGDDPRGWDGKNSIHDDPHHWLRVDAYEGRDDVYEAPRARPGGRDPDVPVAVQLVHDKSVQVNMGHNVFATQNLRR